jgi:acetyl/propionyl-CoA carboxylase alpha subunit
MVDSLRRTRIEGVTTNLEFPQSGLGHRSFYAGDVSTGLIGESMNDLLQQSVADSYTGIGSLGGPH